jgi:hypothetical protein
VGPNGGAVCLSVGRGPWRRADRGGRGIAFALFFSVLVLVVVLVVVLDLVLDLVLDEREP